MSATTAFQAFDVECSNCEAEADVDVTVYNAETGEVARDCYACNGCAASISVPSAFCLVTEEL